MTRALSYVPDEIKSYLPSGWSLAAENGRWDAAKSTWTIQVFDVADHDWQVAVKSAEAEKMGRLEALKRAMDRVYREGLG
ncbi:MAG TPA: hypothetical protein VIG06_26365 [Kofleriaceae bacterium]|jgi:hypothetical protein